MTRAGPVALPDALLAQLSDLLESRSGKIVLTDDATENGLRPSVSYLFRSVGDVYGRAAVAGLLTGMGPTALTS